ncbi:hypothetical protein CONLIGDRAFT_499979 [Coniochaeta ligniaria NRRL 30616]|uniref:VOC domain-containing protein n=1 Tax=Coniochaeta ligniaria NRRL 30616 TaxID=1408157 RepID=A0A1J7J8U4_9PEZI|nr:hypothetical protein CONLIGDRAFT_499979 [Coniochaeta ligniaria NRRL 30616]
MPDSVTPSTAKYNKPPPNGIAFTRILVRDFDGAQSFYASVFGWRFMDPQPNFPRIFFTGGEVMGGLHLLSSPADDSAGGEKEGVKQRVVDYIMVSDVDETLKKVIENGGTVTKEKFTEGDHTELAEFEFEGVVHGVLRWLKS